MSTITREFTKEQLQQIEAAAKEVLWPVVWSEKKAREHFNEKITPEVVLELARIALASLEAEPVAWEWFYYKQWNVTNDQERAKDVADGGVEIFPLYRRAVMIQGAEHVSNRDELPDGWVACSERLPERDVDVQVYCADKKEQMVGYMERNEQDGYFRFASLPNGGGVYCQPTHWMPLPAAPQQEVKS